MRGRSALRGLPPDALRSSRGALATWFVPGMRLAIGVTYKPVPSILGVSPHGVFAAVGIGVGAMLLNRELQRRAPALTAAVDSALAWAIVAGIVGARSDYVLSHRAEFHSVASMVAVWDGGLALFGGLMAGCVIAGVLLARRRVHLPRLFDITAPLIALAIAIGRVGDLLIVDHLGRPPASRFALGYRVGVGYHLAPGYGTTSATPPGVGQSCRDVGAYFAGCTYHLTAGYDLIGAALLAGLLFAAHKRLRLRSGSAACVFALWYGTQRLVVDRTRGVDERVVLDLSGTQLLAIVWIVIAIVLLILITARKRGLGEPPGSPPSAHAPLLRCDQPATSI
jgi:phosphatidylglycerol:prolipoprotein diacylglycerol transferase